MFSQVERILIFGPLRTLVLTIDAALQLPQSGLYPANL